MKSSYRRYCRAAAVIFSLVTIYTVPGKIAQGHFAHDWLHSTLHLGSAALGAYAGWAARGEAPARAFTGSVGLLYLFLGCIGWFVNGFALSTPLAIPLGPADNVFHLVVGLSAIMILLANATGHPRPGRQPSAVVQLRPSGRHQSHHHADRRTERR